MTRWLVLLAALLALGAAPASAQEAGAPPAPVAAQDDGDPDEPVSDDEPADDEDGGEPVDAPECAGGEGDYEYCDDPCRGEADDYGDYQYCPSASGGGPEARREDDDNAGAGSGQPSGAVRPLPAASLPYTGSETSVVALLGLGLLMVGAGARLRLARR